MGTGRRGRSTERDETNSVSHAQKKRLKGGKKFSLGENGKEKKSSSHFLRIFLAKVFKGGRGETVRRRRRRNFL